MTEPVYIGLGSNLGDRRACLAAAVREFPAAGLPLLALSSVWETEPVGTDHPAWFLNLTLVTRSDLEPLALLDRLQAIEGAAGRVRGRRNAPRTLDLDLLMVGERRVDEPRLTLPHPAMWGRRFVLEPLAEIAPELRHPDSGQSIGEVCRGLAEGPIVRRIGPLIEADVSEGDPGYNPPRQEHPGS